MSGTVVPLHPVDVDFLARIDALRSPEVTATHSGPPRLPSRKAISEHFTRIVAEWEPHPFTPQERETVRLDGLRYLVIVRRIEQVQRDIYPRPLPEEVQAQLSFARQSYMLRCFRLFRINDLPTEIISNILRFMIWDSMRTPVRARLHITWTCRRWREIALADSTLWNAIWFRGNSMERAWAWFERARATPLDIRIDCDSSGDDSDPDESEDSTVLGISTEPSTKAVEMRQMLLRLFTKLATIRMLIVVVQKCHWKKALGMLELLSTFAPSTGVPMLKRVEFHRGGLENEDRSFLSWPKVIFRPFLGGAVAPCLEYLSLNGVSIDWSTSTLANLTTLDIRRFPQSHFLDAARFREVLMNCPRLHKLCLDGAGPKFEEQGSKPVELPHLRVLVVADLSRRDTIFLFSQISAPSVNSLTLMNLYGDDYLPIFLKITSAFPKVRLLTTYSVQFDSSPVGIESMRRWLDSMPLLAYLRVANVVNHFFEVFSRPDGPETPVAPHLKFADFQSVDPGLIVQWVKDRARHRTPLEKIYFSEELGGRLDDTQIRTLMGLSCKLAKLPRGATAPEEAALSL
ncbi:F-box domain-containing protein [Mycena sanguinolenta]|uniref:F-box domain-containing protein n=1 Tax=Mycena sanguinolenta TaxID=230812 RepID=A0A8H6YXB4_9AGAR|nr:F-box domain-containing protein [Mycena sanguinolenta]